ncbi:MULTISPECIES: phosphatase PAP2 family protein [Halomonas]|uniref:undecaprenyl-diphosphate phosphatase n=2 Tax=Halomonas TaxID=2745 RepID=A0AAU7KML1_9GAMM|nr:MULTISPECIES: phosphatase PAP2 family protein [Halomonas]MBY5941355.1 phosphatase PAP2 family protein [Halomonas sp. DP5N14-9]MBY6111922.1 phosphatase PAP2 family protein [Halomonas sp. DP1Y21-3]
MPTKIPQMFDRLDMLEWQLCQRTAGLSIHRPWLSTLKISSKLGDWPIWVALILALPAIHGRDIGLRLMLEYTVTAVVAIAVYKLLKTRLCRERPFITFGGSIQCNEPARDRYSFPSGHTMHAVMFCTLVAVHSPALLPWLLPLAGLIAISRVGLGLHYYSDVLAGAALGYGMALASLGLSSTTLLIAASH